VNKNDVVHDSVSINAPVHKGEKQNSLDAQPNEMGWARICSKTWSILGV